jgi:hypothetical protein
MIAPVLTYATSIPISALVAAVVDCVIKLIPIGDALTANKLPAPMPVPLAA